MCVCYRGGLNDCPYFSFFSIFLIQWNLPERPPLLSDHLTKIPIGFFVSQIAISKTSPKRPPLLSDHLTKISIGSSVSQIAISKTSPKPPLLSDHQSLTSRVVAYGRFYWISFCTSSVFCFRARKRCEGKSICGRVILLPLFKTQGKVVPYRDRARPVKKYIFTLKCAYIKFWFTSATERMLKIYIYIYIYISFDLRMMLTIKS